jgi:hypothetical protein
MQKIITKSACQRGKSSLHFKIEIGFHVVKQIKNLSPSLGQQKHRNIAGRAR